MGVLLPELRIWDMEEEQEKTEQRDGGWVQSPLAIGIPMNTSSRRLFLGYEDRENEEPLPDMNIGRFLSNATPQSEEEDFADWLDSHEDTSRSPDQRQQLSMSARRTPEFPIQR